MKITSMTGQKDSPLVHITCTTPRSTVISHKYNSVGRRYRAPPLAGSQSLDLSLPVAVQTSVCQTAKSARYQYAKLPVRKASDTSIKSSYLSRYQHAESVIRRYRLSGQSALKLCKQASALACFALALSDQASTRVKK